MVIRQSPTGRDRSCSVQGDTGSDPAFGPVHATVTSRSLAFTTRTTAATASSDGPMTARTTASAISPRRSNASAINNARTALRIGDLRLRRTTVDVVQLDAEEGVGGDTIHRAFGASRAAVGARPGDPGHAVGAEGQSLERVVPRSSAAGADSGMQCATHKEHITRGAWGVNHSPLAPGSDESYRDRAATPR